MPTIFDPFTIPEHHFLLASHLPPGRAWASAFDPDDDFGKLFLGLAAEFYRFQVLEKKLFDEMDINQTYELLTDWEKSVGIPNECFSNVNNLDTRRKQVLQIFSKFGGVQTKEDFERVGAVFGFTLNVYSGSAWETFPLSVPLMFSDTTKEARHTIIIELVNDAATGGTFPLPIPIPFILSGKDLLQCMFDKLAPANVIVIIIDKVTP